MRATANATPRARAGAAAPAPEEVRSGSPRGAIAVHLLACCRRAGAGGLLYLSSSEREAEQLGANLHALERSCAIMVLPRWDCLPYDAVPPSRDIMGRRASVLRRLAEGIAAPLVIATPDAALQRVPPRGVWQRAVLRLRRGARVAPAELSAFLERAGYDLDSRVDQPGEANLQGRAADVFPAGALGPIRIEYRDGRIAALHSYDPASQRTMGELEEVVLDAASEFLPSSAGAPGCEPPAWLSRCHGRLETLFDYLPRAAVVADAGVERRVAQWLEQIAQAHDAAKAVSDGATEAPAVPEPSRLYLGAREWRTRLGARKPATLAEGRRDDLRVPLFATERSPTRAYRAFLAAELAAGRRVVLTAADAGDLEVMCRRAEQAAGGAPRPLEAWQSALDAPARSVLALQVDFEAGFLLPSLNIAVVAAADLLGSRAGHEAPMSLMRDFGQDGAMLRLGDAVVHLEHGIGRLSSLETVSAPGMPDREAVRLDYAGGATLLVPCEEMGSVWRYGAAPEAASLDRLGSESWRKRRQEIQAEIAETSQRLAEMASEREAAQAPRLLPPARDYEAFAARFPFFLTPDQTSAVEEVLKDLASGRPMDRLVCGDVGFGKTEVALRAAAAAALGGSQVAVIVPTTVLARQHIETFRRRFAGFGVEIGHLSRLSKAAEAQAVRAGLADGSIRIVIGTHAVMAKEVRFRQLGLVILDEEQRFGAREKARLRGFGRGIHMLTLTATPIPRTLQRALVGLQSLSVIATPPARRLPIRTRLLPLGAAILREALMYVRRRGGQSFIVCPRIADIGPMERRLRETVPELALRIAHGRMPADRIDETMVRFADGEGDVLLSTDIIENGLDLPRANTILIWRPDRFGAAQLHQLRGRVGRGRRRGFAYLLTDPRAKIAPATEERLRALESLNRLGAGLAISGQDLDLRGAGDILGERQAGHVRLIGVELYRHLLESALARLKGKEAGEEQAPVVNHDAAALIPADYVIDAELRINLYARLARLGEEAEIEELAEEIEDRFGPVPGPAKSLLELARARALARRLGISRVDAGPQGIALSFHRAPPGGLPRGAVGNGFRRKGDRLLYRPPGAAEDRLGEVLSALERLRDMTQAEGCAGMAAPAGAIGAR